MRALRGGRAGEPLFDEIHEARNIRGVDPGRRRAHGAQTRRGRGIHRLGVEVPQDLHVIRDEAERDDDDGLQRPLSGALRSRRTRRARATAATAGRSGTGRRAATGPPPRPGPPRDPLHTRARRPDAARRRRRPRRSRHRAAPIAAHRRSECCASRTGRARHPARSPPRGSLRPHRAPRRRRARRSRGGRRTAAPCRS